MSFPRPTRAPAPRQVALAIGGLLAFAAPPDQLIGSAAAAGSTEIAPRILAQQGFAITLDAAVLQGVFRLITRARGNPTGCLANPVDGSEQVISLTVVSPNVTDIDAAIYYDNACTRQYLRTVAVVTGSSTGSSTVETVTATGPTGAALGTLSLNETLTAGGKFDQVTQTGTFTPASGAPVASLGRTCKIPVLPTGATAKAPCELGIAQDFPSLGLSLASVTPLTLTIGTAAPLPVTLSGKGATLETGALGALSIIAPTADTLGIAGTGTAYGTDKTAGKVAAFTLFPPTPTHWRVTDAGNAAVFTLALTSDATHDWKGHVASTTGGTVLAKFTLDESGTGTITYQGGTKAAVTSWLPAD